MNAAQTKIRLAEINALIDAYIAAITAISVGGAQEYNLDTGQTVSKVKKIDLQWMDKTLNSLLNLCTILELRLGGGGTVIVRPIY